MSKNQAVTSYMSSNSDAMAQTHTNSDSHLKALSPLGCKYWGHTGDPKNFSSLRSRKKQSRMHIRDENTRNQHRITAHFHQERQVGDTKRLY
jgi:hypothetical protein